MTTPNQETKSTEATPTTENAFIDVLRQLAMDPKEGEEFVLGGRTFTRRMLFIENEQALGKMLIKAIKETSAESIEDALKEAGEFVIPAAALILCDQDATANEAWIRSTRGITTESLIDVVVKQMVLNNMVSLLGKVFAIGAIAYSTNPKATV